VWQFGDGGLPPGRRFKTSVRHGNLYPAAQLNLR
jgi:hypothetical protein